MNSNAPRVTVVNPPEVPRASKLQFPFQILFAVWLSVVVTVAFVTMLLPRSFTSSALIRVNHDQTNLAGDGRANARLNSDPFFFQKELEIIVSRDVLDRVVNMLDLNSRCGRRYNDNQRLKTADSVGILKGRLSLRPGTNSSLIRINSYSEDRSEAAQLANATAEAYQAHRREQRLQNQSAAVSIVDIVERASPSQKPARPNTLLNNSVGLVAGALAGEFLALLVFLLRRWECLRRGGSDRTQIPLSFRRVAHLTISLVVGVFVGYLLAMPMDLGSFLALPVCLALAGAASAFIELVRLRSEVFSPAVSHKNRWNDFTRPK